jgi:hypothetical protein
MITCLDEVQRARSIEAPVFQLNGDPEIYLGSNQLSSDW